jgi:hypothetical protein
MHFSIPTLMVFVASAIAAPVMVARDDAAPHDVDKRQLTLDDLSQVLELLDVFTNPRPRLDERGMIDNLAGLVSTEFPVINDIRHIVHKSETKLLDSIEGLDKRQLSFGDFTQLLGPFLSRPSRIILGKRQITDDLLGIISSYFRSLSPIIPGLGEKMPNPRDRPVDKRPTLNDLNYVTSLTKYFVVCVPIDFLSGNPSLSLNGLRTNHWIR